MLNKLPDAIIIKLLSEVDLSTFGQLRRISTIFWDDSKSDAVWEQRLLKDFGQQSLANFNERVRE